MQKLIDAIEGKLAQLKDELDREVLVYGTFIFNNNESQILSQSAERVEVIFSDDHQADEVAILFEEFEDELMLYSLLCLPC